MIWFDGHKIQIKLISKNNFFEGNWPQCQVDEQVTTFRSIWRKRYPWENI